MYKKAMLRQREATCPLGTAQRSVGCPERLSRIASALRKTTEFLAREIASPTEHAPLWTEFEWRIAQSAVAMHGVASILGAKLRWAGPSAWQRFLDEQKRQSIARHALIAGLIGAIDSRARDNKVALVALKGAALHEYGIYSAGERPMADIDLLVREDDTGAAAQALLECGYVASCNIRRHQIFAPTDAKQIIPGRLGEHVDVPIKVEVHTRIYEQLPIITTDITEELFPRSARAGLNSYPSIGSLMMHLLLHAAGNIRARALRLIQLHDIASVAARFDRDVWRDILARRVQGHALWWAFPPLALTSKYYPGSVPTDVIASLGSECSWVLGTRARNYQLTDVSWSNIHIEAFPGLEWSRTAREAAVFMSSRIKPSRGARAELREGAAAIPGGSAIGWYERSHPARILRWIFLRPPRVQTILAVRAALIKPDEESAVTPVP
jgi:hypothetical protein